MASSASVASLVITLETGLSDEEGPLEQSHLGDKSWDEGDEGDPQDGTTARTDSGPDFTQRTQIRTIHHPGSLPQSLTDLDFEPKFKTCWFWSDYSGPASVQTLLGQAGPGLGHSPVRLAVITSCRCLSHYGSRLFVWFPKGTGKGLSHFKHLWILCLHISSAGWLNNQRMISKQGRTWDRGLIPCRFHLMNTWELWSDQNPPAVWNLEYELKYLE